MGAVFTQKIVQATTRVDRNPYNVRLVAVSKRQSVSQMIEYASLCHATGTVPIFGENYVQEFGEKRKALEGDFKAHLIGPLQSNKAREAVSLFDMIESVHSLRIAQAIDKEASKIAKVQDILIQVNVSADPAKSGFGVIEVRGVLAELRATLKNVRICGLMTILENFDEPARTRQDYRRLFDLFIKLRDDPQLGQGEDFCELSMGMSADFEIAIEEGATLIRVGTAIFGERHK